MIRSADSRCHSASVVILADHLKGMSRNTPAELIGRCANELTDEVHRRIALAARVLTQPEVSGLRLSPKLVPGH